VTGMVFRPVSPVLAGIMAVPALILSVDGTELVWRRVRHSYAKLKSAVALVIFVLILAFTLYAKLDPEGARDVVKSQKSAVKAWHQKVNEDLKREYEEKKRLKEPQQQQQTPPQQEVPADENP